MAISPNYLSILKPTLDQYFPGRRDVKTTCLSYPDIVVPRAAVESALGVTGLPESANAAAIRKWHGLPAEFGPVCDTDAVLAALGLVPTYVDIVQTRGPEIVLDLNNPIPESMIGASELVLDTGTMEHCFNIGQAFKNACDMLSVGGVLMTAAPVSMVNHGFWNYCPTALFDCLDQNGFAVSALLAVSGTQSADMLKCHAVRLSIAPEWAVICVAQKVRVQPWTWPVQTKYKGLVKNG